MIVLTPAQGKELAPSCISNAFWKVAIVYKKKSDWKFLEEVVF